MPNTTGLYLGLDYHNGMAFSTHDNDQDEWTKNCAALHGGGGWWSKDCHHVNLNGNRTTSEFNLDGTQMRISTGDVQAMVSSTEMKMIRVD